MAHPPSPESKVARDKLREKVAVDSVEHQLRIVAWMLSNDQEHTIENVAKSLSHNHEDELTLVHNLHMLRNAGIISNKRMSPVLVLNVKD